MPRAHLRGPSTELLQIPARPFSERPNHSRGKHPSAQSTPQGTPKPPLAPPSRGRPITRSHHGRVLRLPAPPTAAARPPSARCRGSAARREPHRASGEGAGSARVPKSAQTSGSGPGRRSSTCKVVRPRGRLRPPEDPSAVVLRQKAGWKQRHSEKKQNKTKKQKNTQKNNNNNNTTTRPTLHVFKLHPCEGSTVTRKGWDERCQRRPTTEGNNPLAAGGKKKRGNRLNSSLTPDLRSHGAIPTGTPRLEAIPGRNKDRKEPPRCPQHELEGFLSPPKSSSRQLSDVPGRTVTLVAASEASPAPWWRTPPPRATSVHAQRCFWEGGGGAAAGTGPEAAARLGAAALEGERRERRGQLLIPILYKHQAASLLVGL
ncbi:uncharacterized protein [Anser cygnoides]|uniref:uncharacterized protein n=1 Tax=Anser cygnoides TaxID=8845 RepID=UPI0034D1FB84